MLGIINSGINSVHGVEYLGDRTVVCYNDFSTVPTGDVGVTAMS